VQAHFKRRTGEGRAAPPAAHIDADAPVLVLSGDVPLVEQTERGSTSLCRRTGEQRRRRRPPRPTAMSRPRRLRPCACATRTAGWDAWLRPKKSSADAPAVELEIREVTLAGIYVFDGRRLLPSAPQGSAPTTPG